MSDHSQETQESARLKRRGRRLVWELSKPYRGRLAIAVALLLVQNFASLAGPFLLQLGIDDGIPDLMERDDPTFIIWLAVAFVVAAVVEYVTKRGFLAMSAQIGQSALADLRERIYRHVQRLDMAYFQRTNTGQIIARMTNDVNGMNTLLENGLDELVVAGLNVASIAVILFFLDWRLALITVACYPVLWWLVRWFNQASSKAYRQSRDRFALLIVHFVESVRGIRAVQAFRGERRSGDVFGELNEAHRVANSRTQEVTAVFIPAIALVGALVTTAVFIVGGWLYIDNAIELGVLTAFLLYLRRFFDPMEDLFGFYDTLQSATTSMEKIAVLLDRHPGVPEPTHPVPVSRDRAAGAIRFADVSFEYRSGHRVLGPTSLDIPGGQTVAIVGQTGAGKTTLVRLVARFADPTHGSVELDGVNLRKIADQDLRRLVTLVTQEVVLFRGTVAQNIAMFAPDADPDAIVAAAVAVGADAAIAGLPNGYDTDVGSRGSQLSAGQRQLVAFARAFYADPAVLILDEATASLDIPTEQEVQRGLRRLLHRRTTLIVAHRLSTVRTADRVLVVNHGVVVEDGSPAELADGDGPYAALHAQWVATTH